jgi:hypothetical protein
MGPAKIAGTVGVLEEGAARRSVAPALHAVPVSPLASTTIEWNLGVGE